MTDARDEYRIETTIQVQDGPAKRGDYFKVLVHAKLLEGSLENPKMSVNVEYNGDRLGKFYSKNLCSLPDFKCPIQEGEEREFVIDDYFVPSIPDRFLDKAYQITVDIKEKNKQVECISFELEIV